MNLAYTVEEVAGYTAHQLNAFFPDGRAVSANVLKEYAQQALDRTEFCFRRVALRSYCEDGQAKFDLLHSDQYCSYLYLLANSIYRSEGDPGLASKVFYLNKALHAFNCMYDAMLPDIFLLLHVVGTVLGKATYANYLVVRQNCTIGALGYAYPVLGEKLILSAGASVIGGCRIGANVMIGPGCTVMKEDIPDNSLVTRTESNTLKSNSDRPIKVHFNVE
ncbi:MAG TPA: hypothetical protein VFA07_15600 [Chthonomonadaceae bacterium]|nr:hypothetical protein [Chthonomonadaceae bacterium]